MVKKLDAIESLGCPRLVLHLALLKIWMANRLPGLNPGAPKVSQPFVRIRLALSPLESWRLHSLSLLRWFAES